jgi:hypothetical protein
MSGRVTVDGVKIKSLQDLSELLVDPVADEAKTLAGRLDEFRGDSIAPQFKLMDGYTDSVKKLLGGDQELLLPDKDVFEVLIQVEDHLFKAKRLLADYANHWARIQRALDDAIRQRK